MKSPAGKTRARRPVEKKPVQLNLRRVPTWPEEDELDEPPSSFWKWFALIFLVHVIGFIILLFVFHGRTVPPPTQFISIVPAGDLAKGTPGQQAAHKIAPTTPAPAHASSAALPPPPAPVRATPPKPKIHHLLPPVPAPKPPPILKEDALVTAPPIQPTPPPQPQPQPPRPKIKIDLTQLVDAPESEQPVPHKTKPKPHPKKVSHTADETPQNDDTSDDQTSGLSRDEVAARLGNKLKAAGIEQGRTNGPDGSTHSKANAFADFYQSIHDQVMGKWSVPNIADPNANDPIVRIHVNKDGQVPADRVTLERSSNNPAIDQSALEAARSLGYTLQPLPDGCPPDISITFNLHQQ